MKNNNSAAVRRLAKRSFKASRQRNIIAVCAIALTTILFTALFTMGLGAVDAFQKSTMRQSGSSSHAVLKYITAEQYDAVKDHSLLEQIGHGVLAADRVDNEELLKRHGELWYRDEAAQALSFNTPTTGRAAQAADEITADTITLQMLGVQPVEGAEITLQLNVKGQSVTRSFRLVGWWQADPAFSASILLVGEGYLDAYAGELQNAYHETGYASGVHFADMMFRNSIGLEGKLAQVVEESGLVLQNDGEHGENIVGGNVNWAYLSTGGGMGLGTIAGAVLAVLLIAATGYLIIYNIFQISVLRDIRFYGLLKTIGATSRQIKRIIRLSALWLCVVGIPVGMLAGYFLGAALLPLLMQNTTAAGSEVTMTASPWMFVISGLFALATVLVSVAKPGRMAAAVSPVEAVRYSEGGGKPRKKAKKGRDGGKLGRMALANLGRNKKRTALVLLSLTLSLVLLNLVFTVANGLDLEKYVSRQTDVDFMVSHAAKMNFAYTGIDEALDEEAITALEALPGFANGGRIYASNAEMAQVDGSEDISLVLGADDWVLETFEVVDGEIDLEKLKTGAYVVQGVHVNDHGMPDEPAYAVGDTVVLHHRELDRMDGRLLPGRDESREYTILATVALNGRTHTDGYGYRSLWVLPSAVYAQNVQELSVMLYRFEVQDGYEAAVESWLADYTTNEQPLLAYISRASAMAEFASAVGMVVGIGGVLSAVIGFIGILNFINSILTSIIARRQEFAVLESIGMTRGQLRRMLCYEGLFYAVGTILLSLVLGSLVCFALGNLLQGMLWFFSFRFILLPLMLCWPVLLVLAVAVPLACYAGSGRESVILRLRMAE